MIFLVLFAVIVAVAGLANPKYGFRKNNYKSYMWLCGALMLLISAFRTPYAGATDTYLYVQRYISLQDFDSFRDFYESDLGKRGFFLSEAGFYYVFWLFGHVIKSGQMAIIISSVLITVSTCLFIRRNSQDIPVSMIIYVCLGLFTFNMNGMRQAMAMSICLFAYEYVKQRRLVPFVLTILLAMMFHKTAVCFLPVFVLPKLKNSLGHWTFFILGLGVCLLSVNKIIDSYQELSGINYRDNGVADGGGLFVILLYLGAIALTLNRKRILEKTFTRVAFLATLTGFAAYITRYFGSGILERISYYYFYFPVLLIPEVFQEYNEKEHKVIKTYFVIGCVLLFAYRVWKSGFQSYKFFFM